MNPLATCCILVLVLLCLGACRAVPAGAGDVSAWTPAFEAPTLLQTDRVRLEPLAAHHVELDFAALMGSREHLRRTLHWSDWPRSDFTLEENLVDLVRHHGEFERHEAYAYTVLTPDGARCLGCVYLNPAGDEAPREARLAFWVIEEELATDLDRHLLTSFLGWVERHFPLDDVAVDVHVEDARGARILAEVGLEELAPVAEERRRFAWRRD